MPHLKGVPYLDLSTSVYAEEIEAWEAQAGLRVSAGDAIFSTPDTGRDGHSWGRGR